MEGMDVASWITVELAIISAVVGLTLWVGRLQWNSLQNSKDVQEVEGKVEALEKKVSGNTSDLYSHIGSEIASVRSEHSKEFLLVMQKIEELSKALHTLIGRVEERFKG